MPAISERLEREFSRVPARAIDVLKNGFLQLAGLSQEGKRSVASMMIAGFGKDDENSNAEIVLKSDGVSFANTRDITVALSMLIATVTNGPEPVGEFLAAGVEKGIFSNETSQQLIDVATLVEEAKGKIKESLEISALETSVLPSFESFDFTIDVRLGVEGENVVRSVPVLIVHIDSDVQDKEIWLQLTLTQTERLMTTLENAMKQLHVAKTWADAKINQNETT